MQTLSSCCLCTRAKIGTLRLLCSGSEVVCGGGKWPQVAGGFWQPRRAFEAGDAQRWFDPALPPGLPRANPAYLPRLGWPECNTPVDLQPEEGDCDDFKSLLELAGDLALRVLRRDSLSQGLFVGGKTEVTLQNLSGKNSL